MMPTPNTWVICRNFVAIVCRNLVKRSFLPTSGQLPPSMIYPAVRQFPISFIVWPDPETWRSRWNFIAIMTTSIFTFHFISNSGFSRHIGYLVNVTLVLTPPFQNPFMFTKGRQTVSTSGYKMAAKKWPKGCSILLPPTLI